MFISDRVGLSNISEAARTVGLSVNQFYRLVRVNKMVPAPQVKRGRRYFYNEAQLSEVIHAVAELRRKGVLNG